MLSRILKIFLVGFLFAASARADDTSPTLPAGGLVPKLPTAIQIDSQEVEISTRRITIHYVLRNPGESDESVPISFSLPDLDGPGVCSIPYHLPRRGEVNYMGFGVLSGGKAIPLQTEILALRDGQDVTSRLSAAGLTPNVLIDPLYTAVSKLPPEERKRLEDEGLIEPHTFTYMLETSVKRHGWCAQWTMRVQFSSTQAIPAHQSVEITQLYSPVVGGGYFFPSNEPSSYANSYCADGDTIGALSRMKASATAGKDSSVLFYEQAIDFLLTSANKWGGPVGKFHLSVLTREQSDILMTCMPGLQRTAPAKYELERADFRPDNDLKIMILQKTRPMGW